MGLQFSLSICLGVPLFWAIGTTLPKESRLPTYRRMNAIPLPQADILTVVTYNIAHGQGFKTLPTDPRSKAYTYKKLDQISKMLIKINADVVLLQEVDLDSARSHRINQATYLTTHAAYPFWACSVVWDENYIPYPYWPVSNHLGRTLSANCILSRYPL